MDVIEEPFQIWIIIFKILFQNKMYIKELFPTPENSGERVWNNSKFRIFKIENLIK